MKLLRMFPLVALMFGGLAVHGMAQGSGGSASKGGRGCHGVSRGGGVGGGGVSCGRSGGGNMSFRNGGGGSMSFRNGGGSFRLNNSGGVMAPGRISRGQGFSPASHVNVRRALPVTRDGGGWSNGNGYNHRNGGNGFHRRGFDHDRDRDHDRGIGPTTFPHNFQDFGFRANYDTPYYRGGWRQTTSPFGIPATFFPEPTGRHHFGSHDGFDGRFNDGFGGFDDGFNGFDGRFLTRRSTLPYFQGHVAGYQPFGTFGINGPYTVPRGGVPTAAVQSALFQRGYYRGPVDGFAGELTRAAIRNYQFQNGIPVTGRVDGTLIRSIRKATAPWLQ